MKQKINVGVFPFSLKLGTKEIADRVDGKEFGVPMTKWEIHKPVSQRTEADVQRTEAGVIIVIMFLSFIL